MVEQTLVVPRVDQVLSAGCHPGEPAAGLGAGSRQRGTHGEGDAALSCLITWERVEKTRQED